ncbi:telomerase protein component 1 isoform X2 [Ambystoma mexicanum]|uniref:telomerase protein component 1 isoform X2 n=1 Tax=Ambystoma mexicanum TaxID=8296 RepID=UPI0037E8C44A
MKVPSGPAVQERPGPTRLQAMSLQNRFLLQNVLTQECEAWSRTTTAFDPKISNSKLSTISIHGPVHEKPSLELGQSPLRPFNSSGDVSPLISGNMALKGADTRNKFLSSAVPKPPLQLHQTQTETVGKVVASGTAYSTSSCATKKLSTLSSIPLLQHGMETHLLKESAHVMEAFGTMCQEHQMQTEDEEDLAEMCNSMPEYLLPAVDDREMESLPVPAGLPEFSQCFPDTVEGLRIKKMKLLNAVCCSLVDGPNFSNCNDPTRKALEEICKEIVDLDPEFILKVALYTRQELNIRTTANFLLAVAAWQLPCRSHLRRYFSAAVQLPSDWLEVPKIYQSLAPDQCKPLALPSCLRRAMTDKFKQFTEYQLAKYNTRTDRGKTCKKKEKAKTDRTAKTSRRHIKVFPSLRKVAPALEELQYKFDTDPDFMSHTPKRKPKEKTKDINLKKLIRRLHITEPAHHVQSLLGCRYPTDLQTFSRSRLPGPWDPQLSGKRMKLKLPDTWERQLSLLGNIPSIWEELIDSKKLPFMAMLRNLRNLVKAGISAKHHKKVISRLSNKEAVTQSRQFPFRFLSAYKVILDLEKQQKNTEGSSHSNADIIGRIFKRVASKHTDLRGLRSFNWTRSTLRAVLGIPVVFQMVKREKQLLQKSRALQYDLGVLKKYRDALDQSIRISAKHNLPPLPGRTVIFCAVDSDMFETCSKAKNLCCPSEEKDRQGDSDSITILEVALLLSLMVKETAEDVQLIFYTSKSVIEASASSDSILENVGSIKEQIMAWKCNPPSKVSRHSSHATRPGSAWEYRDWQSIFAQHAESGPNWNSLMESNSQCAPAADYLLDLVSHKKQVDTFLMISHEQSADSFFMSALQLYRRQVNAEALFISLQPQQTKGNDGEELGQPGQWRDIFLYGFSEQVLRFISVRGSSRLLEHVGRIDERFDLPKPSETLHKPQNMELLPHPGVASPKIRWQSVRVFISSTFRDMHGERDLLIRSVFPELRARAARHFLSIEEIDLRWGITEEESSSNRQLGLCLSEVAQSKIFIGILGERYGHVPQEYSLPKLPHFEWLQSYRQGASITELEAMQFLQHVDRTSHPKAFFYFRDSAFLRSVPHRWLPDFAAESYEAKGRMSELKNRVSQDEGAATSRYSCEWGGVADGKPYVKELEEFGANVLQDVWECIKKTYILVDACASEDEEEMAQEAYRQYQHHQFCARSKLLTSATSSILETKQQSPLGGSVLALSAGPSEGKTVFMAALVNELNIVRAKYNQEDTSSSSDIIFHFSEASPGAQTVERMLARFCALLNQYLKKESSLPLTYRGLVSEFHSLLHSVSQSLRRRHNLILLIDGADHLVGQSGQRTSDWIPEHLPQRVHLILSVDEDSSLLSSLKKRKDASFLPLGPLEPPDRSEIIRHSLAVYGKRLDESAFNNQMRLIMIKKDSRQPLYLKLVSEELRTFAVYEKVSEMIKNFPATLPPLVQQVLGNLEKEHGIETVTISLTALYVARNGLRERDLYSILTMCSALSPINNGITWEEALRVAGGNRVLPMAPFSYLMRSFKSILGLWAPSATSDSKLHLSNSHLRSAIEKRYFKKTNLSKCVHLLTAAHLWKSTDPEQSDPFRKPDAESISELPYHLLHCGQLDQLSILLTNLNFLSAHATLGLLPHLCEVYSLYFSYLKENGDGVPPSPDVEIYGDFIQRNCSLLTQNPSLFYQQVINEPESSAMAAQAHKLLGMNDDDYIPCKGDGSLHTLRWMNKPRKVRKADSKTMAVSSLPTCVSMSSTGRWAVVGTSEGSVHILDTESGQEVNSFETSCDGISACELFTDSSLCVTSFDGWMELWNIRDGSRLLRIEAHKSQITGCSISPDRKQLATVSLDYYLKLWDTTKGMLVGSRAFEFPLNCVTFHPEGQFIAIGSWDKKITIVKTVSWTTVSVLTGHNASIRDVSFAPAGRTVASAALDGEVRLWSWQEQVLLAIFPAHHGMAQVSKFICNGQYLVTAGEDCKVQVWAGCLGQLLRVFGLGPHSPALSVAVSPDNKYLATGYQSDSVKIYTVSSGSLFADCHIPDIAVQALTWLDEKTLVSGSNDGTVRIWDVVDGETKCRHVCQGHQGPVLALAHSPQLLASASEDCTVHIWLVNLLMSSGSSSPLSPCAVLRGHTAGVTCCAFSPDGQLLATGSKDRSLLCWETASSVPSLSRSLPACHRDWITGCAWTSSSILLSCSNDCTLCLWDPKDGQLLSEFLGHQSAVSTVLSMDENVVSVSRDGVLKVWNLAGVELTSISAHKSQINQCAIFSAQDSEAVHATRDGSNLMVTTCSVDGTVKMWRPLMLEKMLTQAGHSGAVRGAAANKDIPSFLTVADDRCLRLWQAPEQKGDDSIVHHCGAVTAIAWSPSRQFVVSGSDTGEIIVWHLGIPLETVQASEQAISHILFTGQKCFYVVSTDHEVARWDLEARPDKGSVNVKEDYSFDVGFLVTSVAVLKQEYLLLLGTDRSHRMLLNLRMKSLKRIGMSAENYFTDIVQFKNNEISVLENSPEPILYVLPVTSSLDWKVTKKLMLQPWKGSDPRSWITSAQPEFGFADATGSLWVEGPQVKKNEVDGNDNAWVVLNWEKKQIHSSSVTALHILDDIILTASLDRNVKIWTRQNLKQVGLFQCEGGVSCLQPDPENSSEIVCGDSVGNVYFLKLQ